MGLTVIHLSDIHIKSESDIVLSRAQLIAKACVSCIKAKSKVVIVVSGDISFSGTKEQYASSVDFFEQLKNEIEEKVNVQVEYIFCPGNHDCDFTENTSVRDALIANIQPGSIDNNYVTNVAMVQENYFDFVSLFEDARVDRLVNLKEIEIEQKTALFISFNSAWMSELNEHPGKIIIPEYALPNFDTNKYAAVFFVFHHPVNWFNPDYQRPIINYIRSNADMVLIGHEHIKDSYIQTNSDFELVFNHGKELQNSENEESGFSIISFDDSFAKYQLIDFAWDGNCIYKRTNEYTHPFEKQSARHSVFSINDSHMKFLNECGIDVRHFAKEDVTLTDLYIYPDLIKGDYKNEKAGSIRITQNIPKELIENEFSIIVGESLSGKTSLSKQLHYYGLQNGKCPIHIDGKNFTTSTESAIQRIIEDAYNKEYSSEYLEEFRQLPKERRIIIIDNFDSIQNKSNRRNMVIDYVSEKFGSIILLLSSTIEITAILKSKLVTSMDTLYYYEIRPFGNKKRKEFISKWYKLNNTLNTDEEIEQRIDHSQQLINKILGNGSSFIPAFPIIIIGVLQNKDAFSHSTHMSRYGYLYESLINQSMASIGEYDIKQGLHNLDTEMLSAIAFEMLCSKRMVISKSDLMKISQELCQEKLLSPISMVQFLGRMQHAKILTTEYTSTDSFKFNYPYIFYYFAAKYIANHLYEEKVAAMVEYMSLRLHNEIYGNIITFVCYFNSDQSVIDNVLINAYDTLTDFLPFDYSNENPVFNDIKDAIQAFIPKKIDSNENVEANKDKALNRMDDLGINDGTADQGEDYIDDTITEEEKTFAAITAALKTIDVLGQILQNYPADISGDNKIEIISEMHGLGMRAVQAIFQTMGYLESDLIDAVYEAAVKNAPNTSKREVENRVKIFMNLIIAGMARAMIHQVAKSLSSELLLTSVEVTYKDDQSISTKLLMADLKMNCLNKVDYDEIKKLRASLDDSNEHFAKGILDSIIGRYLNYNKCDYKLRSSLCNLCGFAERPLIAALAEHQE